MTENNLLESAHADICHTPFELSTGTGKTHTMEGNIHSEEHAGIVPRSVKAILEQLEASDSEYTIRVSFLELCKSIHPIHMLSLLIIPFKSLL